MISVESNPDLLEPPSSTDKKTMKKSLSKYGGFNGSTAKSGSAEDSDDDYGRLQTSGRGILNDENNSNSQSKTIKKTLSRYNNHIVDLRGGQPHPTAANNPQHNSDDEDFGELEKESFLPETERRKKFQSQFQQHQQPLTLNNSQSKDSDDEDFGELDKDAYLQDNNQMPRKKFQSKFQQHQQQLGTSHGNNSDDDEYGDVVDNSIKLPNATLPNTQKKTMKKSLSKYNGFQDAKPTVLVANAAVVLAVPQRNQDSDEEEYGHIVAESPSDANGVVASKGIKKSLSKYTGFHDAPHAVIPTTTLSSEAIKEEKSDDEEYGELEK